MGLPVYTISLVWNFGIFLEAKVRESDCEVCAAPKEFRELRLYY